MLILMLSDTVLLICQCLQCRRAQRTDEIESEQCIRCDVDFFLKLSSFFFFDVNIFSSDGKYSLYCKVTIREATGTRESLDYPLASHTSGHTAAFILLHRSQTG